MTNCLESGLENDGVHLGKAQYLGEIKQQTPNHDQSGE